MKHAQNLKRIEEYLNSAKDLLSKYKDTGSAKRNLMVASLPILAVGSAIAQCQGVQATNVTIQENGQAGGFYLDMNGDNVDDFVIFDPAFTCCSGGNLSLLLRPVNGFTGRAFTNGGSGTVINYAQGAMLGGGNTGTFGGAQWLAFSYNNAYGNFGRPFPKSGYIGIEMNGKVGFIQLTVHSGPSSSGQSSGVPFVISIDEAGIQNANQTVFAGDCSTLPVVLNAFKVTAKENNALIKWETSTEIDNAGFEIERSDDGVNFRRIKFIEGQGSISRNHNYSFVDENLDFGKSYYYRLKQVDFNGSMSYSNIEEVTIDRKASHVGDVYPNPSSNGNFSIDIHSKSEEIWESNILDLNGKILSALKHRVSQSSKNLQFNFSGLSDGTYILKLDTGSSTVYRKINIIN